MQCDTVLLFLFNFASKVSWSNNVVVKQYTMYAKKQISVNMCVEPDNPVLSKLAMEMRKPFIPITPLNENTFNFD